MKTSSLTGKARLFSHTGLANGLLRSMKRAKGCRLKALSCYLHRTPVW